MNLPADQTPSTQAIRRLTSAVWALVVALLLTIAAQVWTSMLPVVLAKKISDSLPSVMSSFDHSSGDEFAGFHDWPIEKKIRSASVIAITTYRKEGGMLKSIVTSIPKQSQSTTFDYKIGDEYAPESRYPRENTQYGDGAIIFFTGSPPVMRLSYSYSDGRVGGAGDIPVEKLGELIKGQK
jgi:hypothetical protein